MRSHQTIIAKVGPDKVAADLSVSIHTARSWARRDSIPGDVWLEFERREWATLEELAAHAAANPRVRPADTQGMAA